MGDFTDIVTVQAGAGEEDTEASAETVSESALVGVGRYVFLLVQTYCAQ